MIFYCLIDKNRNKNMMEINFLCLFVQGDLKKKFVIVYKFC